MQFEQAKKSVSQNSKANILSYGNFLVILSYENPF